MTPDLQLSGGETRLGGKRLPEAPDPILSGRSLHGGAARAMSRLSVGPVTRELEEELPDEPMLGLVEEQVEPRASLSLDVQQLERVSALFKLLSDRTRLAILQILCEGEVNVSTLCERLSLPQPTVSHHLSLLRVSNMIVNRRSGKQVYYRLHTRVAPADAATAGLRVQDSGFAIQILTPEHDGAGLYPGLDGGVLHAPQ